MSFQFNSACTTVHCAARAERQRRQHLYVFAAPITANISQYNRFVSLCAAAPIRALFLSFSLQFLHHFYFYSFFFDSISIQPHNHRDKQPRKMQWEQTIFIILQFSHLNGDCTKSESGKLDCANSNRIKLCFPIRKFRRKKFRKFRFCRNSEICARIERFFAFYFDFFILRALYLWLIFPNVMQTLKTSLCTNCKQSTYTPHHYLCAACCSCCCCCLPSRCCVLLLLLPLFHSFIRSFDSFAYRAGLARCSPFSESPSSSSLSENRRTLARLD